MAAGFGDERRDVFYNDFVILGPKGDPASIASAASGAEAFSQSPQPKSPSSPGATPPEPT